MPPEAETIITATADHLDHLAPLFDGYRQFYQQPSDVASARAFLAERLAHQESVIFLALDDQGQGLGFTQLYPTFSSISLRRLWILNDLFVAPNARQRGVASHLLEAARQHAIQTNAKGLTLQTAHTNLPAQALYESLGWQWDTEYRSYFLAV